MSAPTASVPNSLSVERLEKFFTCPLSHEPFRDAQILNCKENHTFSLTSANELFGKLTEAQQCTRPANCPLCHTRVTSYHPNHALQKLVNAILFPNLNASQETSLADVYPMEKSCFNSVETDGFSCTIKADLKVSITIINFHLIRNFTNQRYEVLINLFRPLYTEQLTAFFKALGFEKLKSRHKTIEFSTEQLSEYQKFIKSLLDQNIFQNGVREFADAVLNDLKDYPWDSVNTGMGDPWGKHLKYLHKHHLN